MAKCKGAAAALTSDKRCSTESGLLLSTVAVASDKMLSEAVTTMVTEFCCRRLFEMSMLKWRAVGVLGLDRRSDLGAGIWELQVGLR